MGATRIWMTLSVGAAVALTLAGCHTGPAAGVSAARAPDAAQMAVSDPPEPAAPAAAAALAPEEPDPAVPTDPAQASVAGELALQRNDCRGAAEDFAVASQGATAQMASHATEVALNCENIPAAWTAAQNWLKAAPADAQAALVYATIALKLYHVPEARAGITTALTADAKAADRDVIGSMQVLAEQSDASAAFAALDTVIDTPQRSAPVLTALGALAVEAYDFTRAEHLVAEALQRDPKSAETLRLKARIAVLRGDATLALATAHEVARLDASDGAFEVAEVLQDLGRTDDARKELERLRAGGDVDSQEIDRRLALLAYDNGDLAQAQKRFTALMRAGDAGDGAMFYLAQIAEGQGDKEAALALYRRLIDSSMGAQARVAAAGLLLDSGKRAEAFALVDDMGSHDHDARSTFDMVVQKAHLLADHGDADGALALLSAASTSYPHHPTLGIRARDHARARRADARVGAGVRGPADGAARRSDDPECARLHAGRSQAAAAARGEADPQALQATPDSPAALDSLGWVRLRRGDSHDAAGILEHAYTVGQDPDIAAHWVEACG